MDGFLDRTTTSGGGVTLRLFAALPVAARTMVELADWADVVSSRALDSAPIEPSRMHVTWSFLGDVAEEYVPAVATALGSAAHEMHGPVRCTTGAVESFGGGRVLAATVDVDLLAVLDAVRDRFQLAVAAYAPQLDRRPWHPHVSIVRAPNRSIDALGPLPPLSASSWVAGELQLYASLPGPDGRQHRLLHAVPMGEPVHR